MASLLLAAPGGSLLAESHAGSAGVLQRGAHRLVAAILTRRSRRTCRAGSRGRAVPLARSIPRSVSWSAHAAAGVEVTADWDDVEEKELEPPALDRLGEIVVPVLVLVGGLELDAVHAAAACVVAGTAGARRVDWLEAGHLPALERPRRFPRPAAGVGEGPARSRRADTSRVQAVDGVRLAGLARGTRRPELARGFTDHGQRIRTSAACGSIQGQIVAQLRFYGGYGENACAGGRQGVPSMRAHRTCHGVLAVLAGGVDVAADVEAVLGDVVAGEAAGYFSAGFSVGGRRAR